MNKAEHIEELVEAIDDLIDVKISVSQGNDNVYKKLYDARANIRERLALLLDIEIN